MAAPKTTRAAGARTPAPEDVANPTPEVGSNPDETPSPEPAPEPAIELSPPPALTPSDPDENDTLITVETTGNFMLVDPTNLKEISHEGSTEVVETQFVISALEDGRLTTELTKSKKAE